MQPEIARPDFKVVLNFGEYRTRMHMYAYWHDLRLKFSDLFVHSNPVVRERTLNEQHELRIEFPNHEVVDICEVSFFLRELGFKNFVEVIIID